MKKISILIVVDVEGIIGVVRMKNPNKNLHFVHREIEWIITLLRENSIEDITICNIHDDGSCLKSEEVEELEVKLIQGVQNLVKITFKYTAALMIGFHGRRNSGGRFDHTFRMDINEMRYGDRSIGEVGAYYRWLVINKIPVIMVSGEGNFVDEIREFNCLIHVIKRQPESHEDIEKEYSILSQTLQMAISFIKNGVFEMPVISEEKVYIYIDNPDKYVLMKKEFIVTPDEESFTFDSLKMFFSSLFDFALCLNRASMRIYNENVKLIKEIKGAEVSKEVLTFMLQDYLEKDIYKVNSMDRKIISDKVGIPYEDISNF